MNKNFSEEVIEINGVEYKLFLNRNGIVSWEKITNFTEFQELLANKYKNIDVDNIDKKENVDIESIKDDANPFELFGLSETIDEDEEKLVLSLKTFYWIALYTNHKLSKKDAFELYEKAEEEYGIDQLTALTIQMISDANSNSNNIGELKNLKALKPKN